MAVVIVLVNVIPSLLPLFQNTNQELPVATTALIATSDFLKNNYLLILFFIFALIVFLI